MIKTRKPSKKKDPTKGKSVAAQSQELSMDQLEQVAGGKSTPTILDQVTTGTHIKSGKLWVR